jgi:uncharacterized Zn finger protein (UPF0148 family)
MKRLTCEMCGSNDLVKQNGMLVCQSCSTKYSVEEAKKMMIEGTVDVSGSSVKIDTSDELENWYKTARMAKIENNAEKAQSFYNLILQKKPKDWEAYFYTTYFSAMQCKVAQISSAAISVSNSLRITVPLISSCVPKDKQYAAISELVESCNTIALGLYKSAEKSYREVPSNIKMNFYSEFTKRATNSLAISKMCAALIEAGFENDSKIMKEAAKAWSNAIYILLDLLYYIPPTDKVVERRIVSVENYPEKLQLLRSEKEKVEKIKKYIPNDSVISRYDYDIVCYTKKMDEIKAKNDAFEAAVDNYSEKLYKILRLGAYFGYFLAVYVLLLAIFAIVDIEFCGNFLFLEGFFNMDSTPWEDYVGDFILTGIVIVASILLFIKVVKPKISD